MNKIKVLVIDDSAFNRRVITEMLNSSANMEVVATAVDGEDGLKKLMQFKPDVVTLDLEMPIMDGFSFIRMSMVTLPTPIVVVSSKNDDVNVFKAMDFGAVDFIGKPTANVSTKLFDIKTALIEKVTVASQIKAIYLRERANKYKDLPILDKKGESSSKAGASSFDFKNENLIELLAVGSSTGGPSALKNLFSMLPIGINAAVVVSQHMPPGFTSSFSQRLNESSEYNIKEAEEGELLEKGKILIAPGGYHLTLEKIKNNAFVRLKEGDLTDKNVPSVNVMFKSVASVFKSKALGIVLTGMGADGKEGVVSISNEGGKIIAESEDTAVVFGMPNEAIKTGLVDKIAPLHSIPDVVVDMCNKSKLKQTEN